MDGPIRELIKKFLLDAEKTGDIDIAFDVMKESVDNRTFQTIIANLKNCMHYQANYEGIKASTYQRTGSFNTANISGSMFDTLKYVLESKTLREIGETLDISATGSKKLLKKFGIKR